MTSEDKEIKAQRSSEASHTLALCCRRQRLTVAGFGLPAMMNDGNGGTIDGGAIEGGI